jgi:hypothetical protein
MPGLRDETADQAVKRADAKAQLSSSAHRCCPKRATRLTSGTKHRFVLGSDDGTPSEMTETCLLMARGEVHLDIEKVPNQDVAGRKRCRRDRRNDPASSRT